MAHSCCPYHLSPLWRWLFYRNFSHIHCLSKSAAAQLRAHGYKAWLHVISNEPSSLECSTGRMESIYSSLPKTKTGMNMPNACCFNCFPDCSIQVLPYLSCNFGCVLFWEPESEEKNLRGLRGALTVCNHVHFLDSVAVSLALFPGKLFSRPLQKNVKPLKILFP